MLLPGRIWIIHAHIAVNFTDSTRNTSKLASFPRLGLASYTLCKRREGAIYQVPILRLTAISDSYE